MFTYYVQSYTQHNTDHTQTIIAICQIQGNEGQKDGGLSDGTSEARMGKHVISIEDQNCNKFSLFVIPFDRSWAHKGLVVIAAPVIPFLLVTLAVIVSVAGKAQYIT